MTLTRRSFLHATPLVISPAIWPDLQSPATGTTDPTRAVPPDSFPSHPPELARDIVGASHANIARVKELLSERPTLARASWDWGFGDWEDALGAASHVGNREIAALLLAHGARPTIFSAAMLGQLNVVKAFVAASPGIEGTPGPHGITLFRHALAGGQASEPVVEYLRTLPGADRRPDSAAITAETMAALTGEYVYGPGADQRLAVSVAASGLTLARPGRSARVLVHIGDNSFFPVGAPLARIRFRGTGRDTIVSVHDPLLILEARRIG